MFKVTKPPVFGSVLESIPFHKSLSPDFVHLMNNLLPDSNGLSSTKSSFIKCFTNPNTTANRRIFQFECS